MEFEAGAPALFKVRKLPPDENRLPFVPFPDSGGRVYRSTPALNDFVQSKTSSNPLANCIKLVVPLSSM